MKNKKLIYIIGGILIAGIIIYLVFFRKKKDETAPANLTSDVPTDTIDLTGNADGGSTSGTTDNPTNDPVIKCSTNEIEDCQRLKAEIKTLESELTTTILFTDRLAIKSKISFNQNLLKPLTDKGCC
jgi:hypothetical protein